MGEDLGGKQRLAGKRSVDPVSLLGSTQLSSVGSSVGSRGFAHSGLSGWAKLTLDLTVEF